VSIKTLRNYSGDSCQHSSRSCWTVLNLAGLHAQTGYFDVTLAKNNPAKPFLLV